MAGLVKEITAAEGAATESYVEIPGGIWLNDVHFTSAENSRFAPIFCNAFIADAASGTPKEFDISLAKGFITRQLSTSPWDLSGGVSWEGNQYLPKKYPVYLRYILVNETGTDRRIRLTATWTKEPGGAGQRFKAIQFTWPWGATWAYLATAKQTNAAGGTIIVDMQPKLGTEMIIQSILVGPDNYAAARTVGVLVVDGESTPNKISGWASVSMDDQELRLPQVGTAETVNKGIDSTPLLARLIAGSDQLRIQLTSPVQNEELTIAVRARVRGIKPTVSKAKSSNQADVTLTETYNKIIG